MYKKYIYYSCLANYSSDLFRLNNSAQSLGTEGIDDSNSSKN